MKAEIVNLQTLFGKPVSYRIPPFQRSYAWDKEKQWEPLWKDVVNVAERWLNRQAQPEMRPHFMGAIVLQQQENTTGEVEKRTVVDGQQRLTTLQMLIRAAQEEFIVANDTAREKRLSRLTVNSNEHLQGDDNNLTKIHQSNESDQRDFKTAIKDGTDTTGNPPQKGITGAYRYFRSEIGEYLNEKPEQRTRRMEALEAVLTEQMQMAAIDLDRNENPNTIFETLNARGEPLKQSDLIRNIVMWEAKIQEPAEAKNIWGMFDSNEFWQSPTKEGRLNRTHIDRFLNYWIVVLHQHEVNANQVAASFRKYINPPTSDNGKEINGIVAEIRNAGMIYKDIEKNSVPEIKTFIHRMKIMETGVVMPVILWLYTQEVPEQTRSRCIKALESYLVRRMLCGIGSTGLNRMFIELLPKMKPGTADTDTINHLSGTPSANRAWPNDRELREKLCQEPIKGAIPKRKMVMEAIEMRLRGTMTEPLGETEKLTIEHIMPQSWKAHWPMPAGQLEEKREQSINAIGNLTLITADLNQSNSNAPWHEKRQHLERHSSLLLNKELLRGANQTWDEDAIAERSRTLADIIVKIWPSPENC